MILEFSVGNFKSFKEIQTLSMQAAKIKSKYLEIDKQNVFETQQGKKLLKTKGIFGANASGKSNLVKAFVAFLRFIKSSVKDENIITRLTKPFALSTETIKQPTFFQLIFIFNETIYRYGFEIKDGLIESEWLFGTPNKREVYYFIRENFDIKVNKKYFKEGDIINIIDSEDITILRDNSLLLTVLKTLGGKLSKKIGDFLEKNITIITGISNNKIASIALSLLEKEDYQKKITNLMINAGMQINDLKLTEFGMSDFPPSLQDKIKALKLKKEAKFIHVELNKNIYNSKGEITNTIDFDLETEEAEGTKKLFTLAPFIFKILEKKEGSLLIIDELDARMHPRLSRKIIEIFNSKETNPNNAQLIFVTHDSNFLDAKLLRRDQITFVDKDKYGASSIYSLVEFKGVRNDASFEQDYLKGKYGAVPFLNEIDNLFLQK